MTPDERLKVAREKPPPYERRVVAFVDVLGWSSIVEASVADPDALSSVAEGAEFTSMMREWARESNENVKLIDESTDADIRVSHFSDTLVISVPATSTAEVAITIMTTGFCNRLLEAGHYTRGAIVCGLVRHTDNVIYGPAIIEAHRLESRVAKYPRIILTPDAEAFFELRTGLEVDFDGLTILDVLKVYRPSQADVDRLERIKSTFVRKMQADVDDLERVAKHRWFLKHLEEALAKARSEAAPNMALNPTGLRPAG